MIKILLLLTLIVSITVIFDNFCLADEIVLDTDITNQKRVMETGFRILNANGIETRIIFHYSPANKRKITNSQYSKKITIYKGLFPFIEDDNELAALLSTQAAFVKDASVGVFKRTAISYSPRKYERKSDRRAVDYMVNAGYDPVALIVILNKFSEQPQWFESYVLRHAGLQRQLFVYRYIYEKYPLYLADNKYIKNPYYQNFLINSQDERDKIREVRKIRLKMKKQKFEEVCGQNV